MYLRHKISRSSSFKKRSLLYFWHSCSPPIDRYNSQKILLTLPFVDLLLFGIGLPMRWKSDEVVVWVLKKKKRIGVLFVSKRLLTTRSSFELATRERGGKIHLMSLAERFVSVSRMRMKGDWKSFAWECLTSCRSSEFRPLEGRFLELNWLAIVQRKLSSGRFAASVSYWSSSRHSYIEATAAFWSVTSPPKVPPSWCLIK